MAAQNCIWLNLFKDTKVLMHHQWAKTVLKHWEYKIIETKISFCSGQTLRELGLPNFNIICVNKKWLRFLFFAANKS